MPRPRRLTTDEIEILKKFPNEGFSEQDYELMRVEEIRHPPLLNKIERVLHQYKTVTLRASQQRARAPVSGLRMEVLVELLKAKGVFTQEEFAQKEEELLAKYLTVQLEQPANLV